MKTTEKLAVITAIEKQVKEVKEQVRSEMRDLFEENPDLDRATLSVNGVKVGTATRKTTKSDFAIVDPDAFADFALSNGFATEVKAIRPEFMHRVIQIIEDELPEAVTSDIELDPKWKDYINAPFINGPEAVYFDTGEVVPGIEHRPATVTSDFMVRGCKFEDVAAALPEGALPALLEGETL